MSHGHNPRAAFGLALGALLFVSVPASAGDLDFDISNSAARFDFRFPLTDSGLKADVGYLHHENDGDVLFGGIQLVDDAGQGAEPFTVGLGARAVDVQTNADDGMAIGIGGFFNYVMPDYNRFAIGGYLYFAPSVTSFNGLDRYLEYSVRGEYRVLKQATVYIGLREVKADFDSGADATIDHGLHLGVSLSF